MSLFESLLNIMKDVESKDDLVDGFTMNPTKKGYKVFHEKTEVCSVSFIEKNNNTEMDMETAQDNPVNYNVFITEIKQNGKIKQYIKKLTDSGFVNISQK